MHTLGKVLAFLVVISAIFASVLTAKLVQVRNSWTAKAIASKAKFNDLKPKVEELERQIDAVKNEIFRSRDLWGSFWPVVQTRVTNPADGTLEVNVGTQHGVREKLLMHAFEIAADGTTVYRGGFLPVQIGDNTATLKPNFRATPDDIREWQSGNWRWRNQLPPGFAENFDKQLGSILRLEETLGDRLRTLEGQKQRLTQANDTLKLREAELIGGDVLPKKAGGAVENREGLVEAIAQEEEGRNQILRKIDELRRTVRSVQGDIEQLQTANIEMTSRLPQPANRSELTTAK